MRVAVREPLGRFAARVELHEPGERRFDERMLGPAAGERRISVGRQIELPGRAVTLGEFEQQFAGARRIEIVGEIRHLPGPSRVALRPLDEHPHLPAARGEAAQLVDVVAPADSPIAVARRRRE